MAQEPTREWVYDFIKKHLPEKTGEMFLPDIDSEASKRILDKFVSMKGFCENKSPETMALFVGLVPALCDLLEFYDSALETAVIKSKAMAQYFGVPDSFLDDSETTNDPEELKRKKREILHLVRGQHE